MANKKEYELAIKIAGMVDSSLGSSCNLTKKQLKEIARNAADANKNSISFSDAMNKAGPGIDAAWAGVKRTVLTTVEAMAAAGAAVTAIGAASVNVGKEFESAMSSWSATASASNEDYMKAREAALEMGRSTSKTATESANALEYMALAGWSAEESIAGLPGILRLSEATGLDLARTSDLVTDSMSALGLEVKDLEGYLDVAAKANNKSNQTAEQLMEAYLGVGGTMKNLRIPIQESAAALGVMANRGIKGSEAGNALNAVMINLTTGTGQAGKMMGKLGISAFDSKGRFIGLQETLKEVNNALTALGDNEEAKNAALAAIGGKQHVDALNDLLSGLNTLDENGVNEWDRLVDDLYKADGALEQMAATKLDNLEGDLAILQSALADTGIGIYDNLKEPLREATKFATSAIYQFSDTIVDGLEETIPTLRRNVLDAKDAVEEFAGPFLSVSGWMLENPDVIAGGLAAIGTTIATLKVVKTINDTASAMNALRVAMMSNPVTAAIGVAALAGGAVVGVSAKVKMANAELKRQNLAEHFGEISLSLEELEEAAGQVIGSGRLERLNQAIEEMGKVKNIAEGLEKSYDAVDKLTWKIGVGFSLNESEQTDFSNAIDAMIQDSLSLVEQSQYTAHLSVNALFGEESETGNEILSGLDYTYTSIHAEVSALGAQLGEAYASAMTDQMISQDEAVRIQGLQESLAKITREVSQAQFDAKLQRIEMQFSGQSLNAESFRNLQEEIKQQLNEASISLSQSTEWTLSGLNLRLERGEISPEEFEKQREEIQAQFEQQQMEIELKGMTFSTQSIQDAYVDTFSQMSASIEEGAESALRDAIQTMQAGGGVDVAWDPKLIQKAMGIDELDKSTKDAMAELWKGMEPDYKALQEKANEYLEAGKSIPQALADGLNDASVIGAIAGDQDALWQLLASSADGNPEYEAALKAAEEAGYALPESVAAGISNNTAAIESSIDESYRLTYQYLKEQFSEFNIDSVINVNFRTNTTGTEVVAPYANPQPVKHALGGIFDQPHFGLFAEEGPEAFIPIDKSERSASIWVETGQALGLLEQSGSESWRPYGSLGQEEQNGSESWRPYGSLGQEEQDGSESWRPYGSLDHEDYDYDAWEDYDHDSFVHDGWNDGEFSEDSEDLNHSGELNPFGLPVTSLSMETNGSGKNEVASGSEAGSGGIQILYSPIYYVNASDEAAVRQATSDDYSRFVQFMKQYEKDLRRLNF